MQNQKQIKVSVCIPGRGHSDIKMGAYDVHMDLVNSEKRRSFGEKGVIFVSISHLFYTKSSNLLTFYTRIVKNGGHLICAALKEG